MKHLYVVIGKKAGNWVEAGIIAKDIPHLLSILSDEVISLKLIAANEQVVSDAIIGLFYIEPRHFIYSEGPMSTVQLLIRKRHSIPVISQEGSMGKGIAEIDDAESLYTTGLHGGDPYLRS